MCRQWDSLPGLRVRPLLTLPGQGSAAVLPCLEESCWGWSRSCTWVSTAARRLPHSYASLAPRPLWHFTPSRVWSISEERIFLLLNWSSGEVAFRYLFLTSQYTNDWIITVDGKFPAYLSGTWLKWLIRNPVEQMERAWFQWATGEAARGYGCCQLHRSSLAFLFLEEMHSF